VRERAQRASTYPNSVVPRAGCQATFAIGFEVGRVDRVRIVVVVMPADKQRSRLHFEDETVAGPDGIMWFQSGAAARDSVSRLTRSSGLEVEAILASQGNGRMFAAAGIGREEVRRRVRIVVRPGQRALVLVEQLRRQAEQ
jgi:hypothetical protein